MMEVQYIRADGSYLVKLNGLPYHLTPGDPLFDEVDPEGVPKEPPSPPPPPPSNDDVNVERDRRVRTGATFQVTGYGPVRVGGDDRTQTNLLALAQAASFRLSQGDLTTLTPYRDEDNVVHDLSPPQVIDLWSKGAAFVSAVFQSSWALKDNPKGIPEDYAEDRHWP